MSLLDWIIVSALCLFSLGVGLFFARRSSSRGAEGYFTGNRNVPWWAIGLSNTATYQSGNGGFVMLILIYGLAGNWLWWSSWIIWMPLVAIIWARMWRRMQIVTTAELISLRYGGTPAVVARKLYALVCCFGFAVLQISYITGFFAKTIAPLVALDVIHVLLIFGGITVAYTMFGGLLGVIYVDVVQFMVLLLGSTCFLLLAVPQHGGWAAILERVADLRPDALTVTPPTATIETLTVIVLVIQGLFFAGSPTAGEGMTAQRFMAARSERHAIGGQLFNAFLALSLRTIPLIGLGIIALSLFWTPEAAEKIGPTPAGIPQLDNAVHGWGELVKRCTLPVGLVGLLVAAEVAAYMSTLSSLINWGSSFVVNDLVPVRQRGANPRHEIWVSRLTTLTLFILASVVTVLYVQNMLSWFLFINSAMVACLLPLAWLRFFWWRFNVWGELAAILFGLPASILVWFVLDFQSKPPWQGLGLLFGSSCVVLLVVTLLTPPESPATLKRFYERCRPPGLWDPVRHSRDLAVADGPSMKRLILDSLLGILACLGLVLATNAIFTGQGIYALASLAAAAVCGGGLILRVLGTRPAAENNPL